MAPSESFMSMIGQPESHDVQDNNGLEDRTQAGDNRNTASSSTQPQHHAMPSSQLCAFPDEVMPNHHHQDHDGHAASRDLAAGIDTVESRDEANTALNATNTLDAVPMHLNTSQAVPPHQALPFDTNEPSSSPTSTHRDISSPDNEAPLSMSSGDDVELVRRPSQHNQIPSHQTIQQVPQHSLPSMSLQTQPTPIATANRPFLGRVSSDPTRSRSAQSHQHSATGAMPSFASPRTPFNLQGNGEETGHIPVAGPGPSSTTIRSRRYADPDHHWLSEDEGEAFTDDVRRQRQSMRRRGGGIGNHGHRSGRDTSPNGEGLLRPKHSDIQQEILFDDNGDCIKSPTIAALEPDLYLTPAPASHQHTHQNPYLATNTNDGPDAQIQPHHTLTTTTQERKDKTDATAARSIKQMHEASLAYKELLPYIPDLSSVTPNLLKTLVCPSCNNLMLDPTTLACGHSQCLLCIAPQASSVLLRRSSPTAAPIAITAAVMTFPPHLERESEDNAMYTPGTVPSTRSASKRTGRAALADGICALPACKKVTKAQGAGRQGLRVDVILQKLTTILRTHLEVQDAVEGSAIVDDGVDLSDKALPDALSPEQALAVNLSAPTLLMSSSLTGAREDKRSAQNRGNRDWNETSPSTSPDEEVKSEENAKRAMKPRKASWTAHKKSRNHSGGSASSSESRPSSAQGISSETRQIAGRRGTSKVNPALPFLVADILSELECHICVTLVYEPLTTPCGHTFCKKCLLRSLDHSIRCPLCRSELPGVGFFVHSPINFTISNLLVTAFPLLVQQRKDLAKQEDGETGLDTPVFVCMVAFPSMPTNLHIYEPRYRLMMRRAMDVNKRFGMVMPSRQPGGYSEYGTMLEIKNMHIFDDGRSLVETVGVHRFKILEKGTLDGYNVAKVERIDDIPEEEENELERLALARSAQQQQQRAQPAASAPSSPSEKGAQPRPSRRSSNMGRSPSLVSLPSNSNPTDPSTEADATEMTNDQLVEVCKGFVEALRTGSTPWLLQRLNNTLPPMPDDHREFTWWMAMLMPIDDHEKARLLQVTSYRLRLRLLVFWIQQMQSSWWFSRGCTIS